MADAAGAAREALIEMVAEADEALMEKFFEAGTLTAGRAGRRPARPRRWPGGLFPVVCTSATANVGVQPLLDAALAYLPSPAERTLRSPASTRRRSR